jgi:FtsH-binding integral membrane protein
METHQLTTENQQVEQATFISKVYGWMACALIVTGLVAWWTASNPEWVATIVSNHLVFYGLLIGELLCVVYLSSVINRISAQLATLLFIIYACLNGLTFSIIFLVFTAESISSTFFITAGTFGVMSIYGYYTKRDLTTLGHLAFMTLIGLIISSVVNLFFQNETISWITTFAGILIFVALTAYDTQKIKNMNVAGIQGTEEEKKGAIMGALTLYLDFINLFLFLLRLFGRRR